MLPLVEFRLVLLFGDLVLHETLLEQFLSRFAAGRGDRDDLRHQRRWRSVSEAAEETGNRKDHGQDDDQDDDAKDGLKIGISPNRPPTPLGMFTATLAWR